MRLIHYLCAFGVALWIIYRMKKKKEGIVKFNFKIPNFRILPLIILIPIAFLYIVPFILIATQDIMKLSGYQPPVYSFNFYRFILSIFAAPVLEELIFRGIMLEGLLKNHKPIKAIFINTLLFTIIHLDSLLFIQKIFTGMFYGWIYYKTKSILIPVIAHISLNLAGNFTSYLFYWVNEHTVNYYIGSSLIILIAGTYLLNKIFNSKRKELLA